MGLLGTWTCSRNHFSYVLWLYRGSGSTSPRSPPCQQRNYIKPECRWFVHLVRSLSQLVVGTSGYAPLVGRRSCMVCDTWAPITGLLYAALLHCILWWPHHCLSFLLQIPSCGLLGVGGFRSKVSLATSRFCRLGRRPRAGSRGWIMAVTEARRS